MSQNKEIKIVEISLQTSVEKVFPSARLQLNFEKSQKNALSLKDFDVKFNKILTEFLTKSIGTGYSLTDINLTPDVDNPYSTVKVSVDYPTDPAQSESKSIEQKSTISQGRSAPIPAPVGNVVSGGMSDLFKGTSWGNPK
jgi:hypothetical protein